MATGLTLPIAVENGRVMRESGTNQLQKIIMLGLSENDSDNPFQDIGFNHGVFDINDPSMAARYANQIDKLFRRLESEGRARLLPGYPKFETSGEELVVSIKYIDMETDRPQEYQYSPSNPTSTTWSGQ